MSNDNPVIQVQLTNIVTPTRAAVARWLNVHLGANIQTTQFTNGRVTWQPPVRILERRNASAWSLRYEDGRTSDVRLTSEHTIDWLADEGFAMTWRNEDGEPIHTTTYLLASVTTCDEHDDECFGNVYHNKCTRHRNG